MMILDNASWGSCTEPFLTEKSIMRIIHNNVHCSSLISVSIVYYHNDTAVVVKKNINAWNFLLHLHPHIRCWDIIVNKIAQKSDKPGTMYCETWKTKHLQQLNNFCLNHWKLRLCRDIGLGIGACNSTRHSIQDFYPVHAQQTALCNHLRAFLYQSTTLLSHYATILSTSLSNADFIVMWRFQCFG